MRFHCFYTGELASIEEQQDCDIIPCNGQVTKAANDSNGVVQNVLYFHVDVVLAEISTILR